MTEHKRIIERLEEYRFDRMLYANIEKEIDGIKLRLRSPEHYYEAIVPEEGIAGGRYEKLYSEASLKRRYDEYVGREYCRDTEGGFDGLMERLAHLIELRCAAALRIDEMESALDMLPAVERRLLDFCIISRGADDCVDDICERIGMERRCYYKHRERALSALERCLPLSA